MPVGAEQRYQVTAAALAAHWRPNTIGAWLASPANPTGELIAAPALRELVEEIQRRGASLVMDEIYHGLVYDEPEVSVLEMTADAFVVNSFSKYFAMTGWRLGWLLVPQELQSAVARLTSNFTICPPTLSQMAAVAAFTPESVAEAVALLHQYAGNRQLLLDGLPRIGIDKLAPTDGAFYVYADVSHLTTDSLSFCSKLLSDTGVAIAPGIDFDTVRGGSFVRLSFAGPSHDIEEAVRRLGDWIT